MNSTYVLAVDLGTGGPKVALVSTDGEIAGSEFVETSLHLHPGGGVEQDPLEWWDAILTGAKRVLARRLVPVDSIMAVGLTSQWSGTVAVDGAGKPLMNALIWMDTRGSRYIPEITGGPLAVQGYDVRKLPRWIRLTGGAPGHAGKDPTAHILYLRHERPEIYDAAELFLEPVDYLGFRLTGRTAASFDSITAHWVTDNRDLTNVRYDDQLLEWSGLDRARLPDLRPTNSILGPLDDDVARELGLRNDVPVVMGTGDVHSAAVGSGAVGDFEGHLYIGTSSWVTCHVPFKRTDLVRSIATIPSAIPGRYLVADEQECAGVCLTFLRDNVFFADDELTTGRPHDAYQAFDRVAAEAPAGSDGVIFTPWLQGERTPVEDADVRGGFFNLSLRTTRTHLVRAVLEGVAYNSRWLLQAVEKLTRRRLDPLNFVGGGANSDLWAQIHADVLGRTVRQVEDPIQANVRGAAFLAAMALGHLRVGDIRSRVPIRKTFTPNPEHRARYDELFGEFTKLYKQNKKTYRRLNRR